MFVGKLTFWKIFKKGKKVKEIKNRYKYTWLYKCRVFILIIDIFQQDVITPPLCTSFPQAGESCSCVNQVCIERFYNGKYSIRRVKIPRGYSESVNGRTENTMAKIKRTKGQTTIYKHTYKN